MERPYPGIAIEDVDVVTGVEVIDGTLAVDLERVWRKESVRVRWQIGGVTHARPS